MFNVWSVTVEPFSYVQKLFEELWPTPAAASDLSIVGRTCQKKARPITVERVTDDDLKSGSFEYITEDSKLE